jgi:uncharacterized membrane protein
MRSRPMAKTTRVVSILMAVGATFLVVVGVVFHWASYNSLRKSLAVVLLLNLFIGSVVTRKIIQKNRSPEIIIQQAYMWLILATMLFGGLASRSLP